jgi:hypothetical protein
VGVLERRWLILSVLLILTLAACRPIDPDLELTTQEAPVQSPLIVMHTNDTWGYYDPCG